MSLPSLIAKVTSAAICLWFLKNMSVGRSRCMNSEEWLRHVPLMKYSMVEHFELNIFVDKAPDFLHDFFLLFR